MRVRSGAERCASRWFALGLFALMACGCANRFGDSGTAARPAPGAGAGAAAGSDPVAVFAAAAAPGSETVAVLPEAGGSARLRLLRSYSAASGRECREVLIGTAWRSGRGSSARTRAAPGPRPAPS
jgi:hypothetical protein